jgi:hypothetical protein
MGHEQKCPASMFLYRVKSMPKRGGCNSKNCKFAGGNKNSCILTYMNSLFARLLIPFLLFSACRSMIPRDHTLHQPGMGKFYYKNFNRSQVPGTKLFIQTAGDYIPDAKKGLYRKDADTYIEVGPQEMVGLDKAAPAIDIRFQQIPYDPVKGPLYYRTETEIGGDKALLYYGKDSARGKEKIWLFIGNLDHMFKVTAVFPADDPETLDTINYSLHSLFEEPDAPYVPADSIRYTLDLGNSGFWYDSNIKNVFYYSLTGREHPANRMLRTQFFVVVFSPVKSRLDQMMHAVMARFVEMNFHFPPYQVTRKKVGGMDAWEVDCKTTFQGEGNSFYALLTGTPARPLLLAGWVYPDPVYKNEDERIAGIRAVAQTLRLKP